MQQTPLSTRANSTPGSPFQWPVFAEEGAGDVEGAQEVERARSAPANGSKSSNGSKVFNGSTGGRPGSASAAKSPLEKGAPGAETVEEVAPGVDMVEEGAPGVEERGVMRLRYISAPPGAIEEEKASGGTQTLCN